MNRVEHRIRYVATVFESFYVFVLIMRCTPTILIITLVVNSFDVFTSNLCVCLFVCGKHAVKMTTKPEHINKSMEIYNKNTHLLPIQQYAHCADTHKT